MPTFPIPIFVALVLAFASLRLWQQRGRADAMVLLLILCAAQSLIIALNQHYGFPGLSLVQPITASLVPAAAWIAYRDTNWRTGTPQVLGPIAVLAALFILPHAIDLLLPGLFVFYGVLILHSAKAGADTQPNALLASGDLTARIWRAIGALLIASAFSDVLIIATQFAGYGELKPWIISVFSVGNLLIIGLLSLSYHLQTIADDGPAPQHARQVADPDLWDRIQTYMRERKPYLDADLTLTRLSRQIGIPAKSLSATINRATGGNVSKYINQARVSEAQRAMLSGDSITTAMLASGFNTKSNFNREFLRVTGVSPSAWLNEAQRSHSI
ncbi:MAG: AraC family transcriptional regulator [Pseudomonadota bacterium]